MREVDVAIVGGGFAGSAAAAMLGRAGVRTALIDPHDVYPPDFRCEKLDRSQLALLETTGLADAVTARATANDQIVIFRAGRSVERRRTRQIDIRYDTLVNTVRDQIPASVERVIGKAVSIAATPDRQEVRLPDGTAFSARLVVLGNGLNISLRDTLGLRREVISEAHSVSIGFDIRPIGRASFGFPALTSYPADPAERFAYLTLFPIDNIMRGNFFVYRDPRDPWLREMRREPVRTLMETCPHLRDVLGAFEVVGDVRIRPVDLYVTHGHRQAGIVLVGDAFATSCPAAGTGLNKALTDVERLCNHHIPHWMASGGMAASKIAAFYDDPKKVACDAQSERKAFRLRSMSIDVGLAWRARRAGRSAARLGAGWMRQARDRLQAQPRPSRVAGAGGGPGV